MKNNIIKNKFYILLAFFLIAFTPSNSKELKFKATEISTFDEGNLIVGEKDAEAKITDELEIFADKVTYDKKNEKLIAEGNVFVTDLLNDIEINSEKINYDKKINEIISDGKTYFNIKKEYKVNSKNVIYSLTDATINSDEITNVNDNFGNKLKTSSFKYSDTNKVIYGKKINLIDNDDNRYFLSEGMVRLEEFELIGKDIKVLLKKDTFGNPDNDPKLIGNSVNYFENKTIIKKGIFTSCKDNNNCPPWAITSKEIIHYKDKKEIHYKNAWLKLYNTPVLYFPKFFHPDPTVDRKSGFLMPTFGDSKNLGASINIPYFHVISESEDLTFKPRFFSTSEYLLQTEFRKVTKNSNHIADFSLNKNDNDNKNGRKTHFFSNSDFNLETDYFDESLLSLKIEKVSNDNYTQLYSLESTSPIIKNTSVLENLLEFSGSKDDFDLNISFETYESMNKLNSDKYEFIYPNYSLTKDIKLENTYFNNIELSSSGNQKKFNTNVYEGVQVNDLLFSSDDSISRFGIKNNFLGIFKNVNSDGKNSSKFKDKAQSELLTMLSYDASLPLIKKGNKYINLLTPRASLRHSPNDTKNLKNEERLLNSDNIFSINRLGFDETIEGGTSLTIGLDYEKNNKDTNDNFLRSKIGTVFRDEINENLPITSTLNKKQSDVVGELNFNPNKILQFDYNYSINDSFDEVNMHKLKNTFTVNNFVNEFTFYEENNLIGNKSYYENNFTYNINQNSSLTFKTRENKTDNLTEYYNLIYEYKNDCLTASLRYNKEYYTNNALKPNEELFFNITLVPLGSTQTESIID